MSQVYTSAYMIRMLKILYVKLGHIPSIREADKCEIPGFPSTSAIKNRFGSWNAALKKAGIKTNRAPKRYTKDELIIKVLELREKCGHVPTIADVRKYREEGFPAISTFIRKFKGWDAMLVEAKLKDKKKPRKNYSDDELIFFVILIAKKVKRVPKQRDVKKIGGGSFPAVTTFIRRFRSWRNTLIVASKSELNDTRYLDYYKKLPDEREGKTTGPRFT